MTSQATRVACVRPRSLIVITRCAWKAICVPPDWLTSLSSLREGLMQPQEKHLTRGPVGVAVKAPADVAVSGWAVEAVSLVSFASLLLDSFPTRLGGSPTELGALLGAQPRQSTRATECCHLGDREDLSPLTGPRYGHSRCISKSSLPTKGVRWP